MKKNWLFITLICISLAMQGQINIIGHNKLNNAPLSNVKILVKANGAISKTITPKGSDFRLQLDFGKVYHIFFQHSVSPLMYMEVVADNIPQDKYEYMMSYELNVPFVSASDEDIDTTVFSKPFHRVIFNGKSKMIDDSSYNNRFEKNIIKKPAVKSESVSITKPETPVMLVGKLAQKEDGSQLVINRAVFLKNKQGEVIRTTFSNNSGLFVFSGISANDIEGLYADAGNAGIQSPVYLFNSTNQLLGKSITEGNHYLWKMQATEFERLTDNHYTSNIGGKLVASASRSKKFFAGKNVYLCNKLNTIIKQTKTNVLGTFVFEDIKPDHDYYIGVDHKELAQGERLDLLSKEDHFIASLDSVSRERNSLRISTSYNKVFNELSISDAEVKMDVKATIFGDNVNNPIGKLKVLLLNSEYQVIDSAVTDDFGTFKFKYLPFLKRFYLSAENTDNILDVFQNILIYSSDDNLVKIMTHQKGSKFSYNPVSTEMTRLRDIELEDPWLELLGSEPTEKPLADKKESKPSKSITENILFENNRYELTPSSKETLDKIILVLNSNKKLKIEIAAHTDSRGNTTANQKLSEMRANTVKNYITSAGIEQNRISSKGYGETRLLNNCNDNTDCDDAAHAVNRRIEFIISGQDKK